MQEISSQNAIDLIKNNPDLVIVDVRTNGEFEVGHIEGALNIDVSLPNFKEEIDQLDKKNISSIVAVAIAVNLPAGLWRD